MDNHNFLLVLNGLQDNTCQKHLNTDCVFKTKLSAQNMYPCKVNYEDILCNLLWNTVCRKCMHIDTSAPNLL